MPTCDELPIGRPGLEMYASDNRGKYPDRLDALIPGNYLKQQSRQSLHRLSRQQ